MQDEVIEAGFDPDDPASIQAAIRHVENTVDAKITSKEAVRSSRSLFDVLSGDSQVTRTLSPDQLHALLDPANYVGQANVFVDAVLASYKSTRP